MHLVSKYIYLFVLNYIQNESKGTKNSLHLNNTLLPTYYFFASLILLSTTCEVNREIIIVDF